jgi:AraC-like DNA-binding protein
LSFQDSEFTAPAAHVGENPPRFIRSGLLTAYATAMGSLGLDPYRMMRKVGLPVAALENPDLRIPVDRVQALLAESATAGACEEFGLRVGQTVTMSMEGPLGWLIRQQPTVRAAIEALRRYLRFQNDNVEIRLHERDGVAILEPILLSPRTRRDRHMVEMTVAMHVQLLRALLGGAWKPARVTFTHGAPKNPQPHRDDFGAVAFDRAVNSIVLTEADLETVLPDADAEMAGEIARYFERRARRPAGSLIDTVPDLIASLLPSGQCSVDQVANHLGIHRRTVHRRLAGAGQSFSLLLDAARREVATDALARGDQPLASIMRLAGFSSASSFSRWFHQAFGVKPSEFRRQARDP